MNEEFDFSKLDEELSSAVADSHLEEIRKGAALISKLTGNILSDALENGLPKEMAEAMAREYMFSILALSLRSSGEAL